MGTSANSNVLQLKNVGDGVTMRLTQCGPMKMGNYPEISFTGVTVEGETCEVRVPQASADRQLKRLDLTYASAVGQTVTIARSANASVPNRPFWDVYLADEPIDAPQRVPNTSNGSTTAKATAEPAQTRREQEHSHQTPADGTSVVTESGAALYQKITDYVLEKIVPKYVKHGLPVSMEGTAAICATLYISATRH